MPSIASRFASGAQRSSTAPVRLPDAQLEHYGELYLALPPEARARETFEQFLVRTHAGAATRALRQLAVRARFDALTRTAGVLGERQRLALEALEREGAGCANGRVVEKLRHHRWPRGRRDFIPESR